MFQWIYFNCYELAMYLYLLAALITFINFVIPGHREYMEALLAMVFTVLSVVLGIGYARLISNDYPNKFS